MNNFKKNLNQISHFWSLNQNSPNLHADGASKFTENSWELTSGLTSKWITFKNIFNQISH